MLLRVTLCFTVLPSNTLILSIDGNEQVSEYLRPQCIKPIVACRAGGYCRGQLYKIPLHLAKTWGNEIPPLNDSPVVQRATLSLSYRNYQCYRNIAVYMICKIETYQNIAEFSKNKRNMNITINIDINRFFHFIPINCDNYFYLHFVSRDRFLDIR